MLDIRKHMVISFSLTWCVNPSPMTLVFFSFNIEFFSRLHELLIRLKARDELKEEFSVSETIFIFTASTLQERKSCWESESELFHSQFISLFFCFRPLKKFSIFFFIHDNHFCRSFLRTCPQLFFPSARNFSSSI